MEQKKQKEKEKNRLRIGAHYAIAFDTAKNIVAFFSNKMGLTSSRLQTDRVLLFFWKEHKERERGEKKKIAYEETLARGKLAIHSQDYFHINK